MTIELTDLPPLPAELVSSALTLVAVPSAGGPVRYKAPLGSGGGAGQGLTFRGAWTAATAYAAYDVLTNAGSCYVVTAAFTSGQSFDSVNLALMAAKGADGAGTAAAIATTLAAGLTKPDGTTVAIASDGTISVPGVSVSDLIAKTDSIGTDVLVINRGGVDYAQTIAAFLAANQISVTALPAGPGIAGADSIGIYSAAATNDVRYTMAQLVSYVAAQISSGSSSSGSGSGSSATAPGQVGSLAAGTPTSTTIPITYTAPSTGTAPITYAASTAPHGTTTWTANAGPFGATGGTLTGLTAATNYDIRVVATNSAGSSTTLLTTGVTTASAGSAYPSLTLVSPTFATGKFGSAISGGSGSATITMPSTGTLSLYFWLYLSSGGSNSYQPFLWLTSGSDQFSWQCGDGFDLAVPSGTSHTIYPPYRDNTWRRVQLTLSGGNASPYINGSSVGNPSITQPTAGATIGFAFDMSKLSPGDLIDDIMLDNVGATAVPSAAATRSSSTIAIWPLDGNGTGS